MPPNLGGKQKTEPQVPNYLAKRSKLIAKQAQALYEDPAHQQPYAQDPASVRSQNLREQMAMNPSALTQAPGQEVLRTLQGFYMSPDSNPYLRAVADRAADEARGRSVGSFAGSGRVGGGAYANALADAEFGTRNALYAGNYDAERGRMQNAVQMAPAAYGLTYADPLQLAQVGGEREMENRRQFDWPYELLDRFSATIYQNPLMSQAGVQDKSSFNWGALISGITNPAGGMMGGGGGGGMMGGR